MYNKDVLQIKGRLTIYKSHGNERKEKKIMFSN